jgi:hypothetical protein
MYRVEQWLPEPQESGGVYNLYFRDTWPIEKNYSQIEGIISGVRSCNMMNILIIMSFSIARGLAFKQMMVNMMSIQNTTS